VLVRSSSVEYPPVCAYRGGLLAHINLSIDGLVNVGRGEAPGYAHRTCDTTEGKERSRDLHCVAERTLEVLKRSTLQSRLYTVSKLCIVIRP
jgi:hypothetical protein